MRLVVSFVAAVVAGVAAPAAADPAFEAEVGYRWGGALVDGVDVHHTDGGHLDAGVRVSRPLYVYAEYDLTALTFPAPAGSPAAARAADAPTGGTGLQHRFGLDARYAFERLGARDGGLAFWVEGGPGIEHYVWDAGGTWTRADFAVGIGATLWARGKRYANGLSFAVRGTFAPHGVGATEACGGPCDMATTASAWDRSITADVSLSFGRWCRAVDGSCIRDWSTPHWRAFVRAPFSDSQFPIFSTSLPTASTSTSLGHTALSSAINPRALSTSPASIDALTPAICSAFIPGAAFAAFVAASARAASSSATAAIRATCAQK
jgi:hypothetical protein